MINANQIDQLHGMDVIGTGGDKIGSVDDVYVDDVSGEPTFALVNTGLFGLRSSFVPIREGDLRDGELHVDYSKDKVKDAPSLDEEEHLDPSDEQDLYDYYEIRGTGTDTARNRTDMETDTDRRDRDGGGTDEAMTRSEEEVHVGTTERETGKVRLRKHVTTEHVTRTVPVRKEEVRVEREPVTENTVDEATDGPAISEDEHTVTLHEEEPVVEKRAVPKERVRLDKDVHTDEKTVEEDVDKETIDVTEAKQDQGRR